MPAWLTWKLFWKVAPYVGGVLLLLGAVWYIDHRGYERAEAEATARENERKLQLAEFNRILAEKVDGLEDSMQTSINDSASRLMTQVDQIGVVNRTIIQPTLVKEIQSEPRFTDPSLGITDGMLRELNRARGFSQQRPCPAGSVASACFAVPAPEPDPGSDNRDPGQ